MRRYLLLIILMFLLNACSINPNSTENSNETKNTECDLMTNKLSIPPVLDFYELGSLLKAEKEQPVENIVKIYFAERHKLENKNKVAIDIGNKGLYLEPEFEVIGDTPLDYELNSIEIVEIQEIFFNNKVDTWKATYIDDYDEKIGEATYNWILRVQYCNGEIYNKVGKGEDRLKIQPEGYQTFVDELKEFVNSKK